MDNSFAAAVYESLKGMRVDSASGRKVTVFERSYRGFVQISVYRAVQIDAPGLKNHVIARSIATWQSPGTVL